MSIQDAITIIENRIAELRLANDFDRWADLHRGWITGLNYSLEILRAVESPERKYGDDLN